MTLLEVAQHRFPFPADGTEMNPRAGLIDLLTYIVRQPIPKLKDESVDGRDVKWTEGFKYFIECWYVLPLPICAYDGCGVGADCCDSLEKEPSRRATPWRMLEHPWMMEIRTKKVDIGHFLKLVWGWTD